MKFHWRRDTPLRGHAGWRNQIATKDDQPNRSAPTLAAAWAGPAELLAAIEDVPDLGGIVIENVDVEVQTAFDDFQGGKRNHDAVIEGTAQGRRVIICIEAKAGKSLGLTVGEQRRAAERAVGENPRSNAGRRLDDLLAKWLPALDPASSDVSALRYQLFTAAAGTVVEAKRRNANYAVLMLHEFLTDDRDPADNPADLRAFAAAVFRGVTLPPAERAPWCVEVPLPDGQGPAGLRFYIAEAVTNLLPRD